MAPADQSPVDLLAGEAGLDQAVQVHIDVVQSLGPRATRCVAMQLAVGCTVADALRLVPWPDFSGDTLSVGIWGKRVAPDHLLREGDRLEIYRGLLVDPKEARRLRYAKRPAQKHRGSGRPPQR